MKYLFLLVILFRLFFFLPQHAFSHSGNTAQIDGCHFCRTNCEGYGFNFLTRHGHGSQTCNESKGPTDPNYLKYLENRDNPNLVTRVLDGDTIEVGKRRVRLKNVNAPPVFRMGGTQAAKKLREMILWKEVTLECGGKSWGRDVCDVFYQGKLIKEADILPKVIVHPNKKKIPKKQTASKSKRKRRFTSLDLARGVIERVVDGDTIVVNNEKIRLLNVDTEESVHPNEEKNTWFGAMTSRYVKKEISNKETILQCSGTDKYMRRLCFVFIEGENFNVELVRGGWSKYETRWGDAGVYHEDFIKAEKEAKKNGLGVWDGN